MAKSKYQLGEFCPKGHKLEGDNVLWRKDYNTTYLRCRICEEATKRKYNEKRKIANREKTLAERYDRILANNPDGSAKYTSLNYLKLGKRAQNAWEPLQDAFDNGKSKCYENSAVYVDYDEHTQPDAIFAFKLCEGCPMLVECGRFAAAYKPAIGVWAGERWMNGEVVK